MMNSFTSGVLNGFTLSIFLSLPFKMYAQEPVDFNRDIRPILSEFCFQCHGPDSETREADLRLDSKQDVFEDAKVVVPGNLAASSLYERIASADPDLVMPPADFEKRLTQDQKIRFKLWIEEGANWESHWSFSPIKKPDPTRLKNDHWSRNSIDHFILARLRESQLQPQRETDRRTLIRRVTLDLTGLPPTPKEIEAFVSDSSANAYERVVDRLLDSPRYGEHMARFWLDAARYGDTHGLHLDNYREMWPYRDWVIRAFNENKSFKQFGIEQLAGDLLDQPSDEQLIATGFNRAHVTTAEGGSIVEEVYVRNVVDRVNTTGTVFMGLTVGCAQCHDHKFDPVSQKEYYQLFAFFNNLDGNAMDGNRKDHAPILKVPDLQQSEQLAELRNKLKLANQELDSVLNRYKDAEGDFIDLNNDLAQADAHADATEFVWIDDELPKGAQATGPWKYTEKSKGPVFSGQRSSTRTAKEGSQHLIMNAPMPLRVDSESILFSYVYLDPKNPPQQIMLQWHSDNWEHRAYWGVSKIDWGTDKSPSRFHLGDLPKLGEWIRLEVKASDVGLKPGALINGWAFTQYGGTVNWDRSGIVSKVRQQKGYTSFARWLSDQKSFSYKGLPANIKKIAELVKEKWTKEQGRQIKRHFVLNDYEPAKELLRPIQNSMQSLNQDIAKLNAMIPTTLIWKERKDPRKSFLLKRGQYDQRGDEVGRAVPAMLPPFPENAPLDRLGFANWLFSDEHPLTARVTVNRFWQQLFGQGIVRTSEDFGAQGEWPSHPALLDWLANEFRTSGWDTKQLMKTMVMSATYRQSSVASPKLLKLDPENRLLARGPRFRLDAETLRDQALALSGLLVEKIGGPGVKPPQPDGLWFVVGYSGSNTVRFKKDKGHDKVHRRSVYTFWKRTAPPPQMNMFDAPSRESVCVRRERTNTPLQALLLMNDPQFVEAARYFANRSMKKHAKARSRIQSMFLQATGRTPVDQEIRILHELYEQNLAEFKLAPQRARDLTAIGETAFKEKTGLVELAALTTVANVILNLDEVISKN